MNIDPDCIILLQYIINTKISVMNFLLVPYDENGWQNMKKNFLVAFNHVHSINAWSLVICAVFFLCGCIVGTFASVSAANTDSVKTYLSEFFLATQSEQNVTSGFLMFFWETCKYHFAVVFLVLFFYYYFIIFIYFDFFICNSHYFL